MPMTGAEGGDRMAGKGFLVGVEDGCADGSAAGVGVLDDDHGRFGSNSCASSHQASRSTRLLKLSSLPCNWIAPAIPCPDPSE